MENEKLSIISDFDFRCYDDNGNVDDGGGDDGINGSYDEVMRMEEIGGIRIICSVAGILKNKTPPVVRLAIFIFSCPMVKYK